MSLSYLLLITSEFGSPGFFCFPLSFLLNFYYFLAALWGRWDLCSPTNQNHAHCSGSMPTTGSPGKSLSHILFSPVFLALCFIKLYKNQDSNVLAHVSGLFKDFPSCYKCTGENMELLATRPGRTFLLLQFQLNSSDTY